jgi:Domain of unknown function (DUF4886)
MRASILLLIILLVCLVGLASISVCGDDDDDARFDDDDDDATGDDDGLGGDDDDATGDDDATDDDDDTTITSARVLFVGNSYTTANDLPAVFESAAESLPSGPEIEIDSATGGGLTLGDHLANSGTMSNIENGNWDFVVIQEQSLMPVLDPTTFLTNAATLADKVNQAGAMPVFFETWARKAGNAFYSEPGTPADPEEMQDLLLAAYSQAATASGGLLAPVGEAWEYSGEHHPATELYSGDGSHPVVAGTYLAACVFVKTILGGDPEQIGWWPGGITEPTARELQSSANQVKLGR